jgi:hypothetical protein
MAATIEYNGTVKDLKPGKKAMLFCSGKVMNGNILVTVPEQAGCGPINLTNIPDVESIDNPSEESTTVVKYQGEIYLLVKEN